MADREFKIKITTTADTTGAKEAKESLNALSPETQKYIEDLKNQERQSQDTEFASRRLTRALGMISPELREIGHSAHMLEGGGMAAAVAGVAIAFEIWNKRVETLTQTMAGMELPDISPEHIKRVDEAATAWQKIADAVENAKAAYHGVEEASDRVTKKIHEQLEEEKKILAAGKGEELAKLEAQKDSLSPVEYAQRKKEIEDRYASAGLKADQTAQRDELAERYRRQANLEISSDTKRREAAGIHIASAQDDARMGEELKAQAEAAEKAKAEALKRRQELDEARAGTNSALGQIGYAAQYAQRYGPGTPGSEALKIEDANVANAQNAIDRYNNFLSSQAERDRTRKHREDLENQASKEAAEAARLKESLPDEKRALNEKLGVDSAIAESEKRKRDSEFTHEVLGSDEGQTFKTAAEAQNILQRGGQLDEAHKSALDRVSQLLQTLHVNMQATLQQLAQAVNNNNELATRIAAIEERQQQFKTKLGSAATP